MRVTFILPGRALRFSGGFKVVYRYAGLLALRGHSVLLLHTPFLAVDGTFKDRVRARLTFLGGALGLLPWSPESWLPSLERVDLAWAPGLSDATVPDADAIVVSFWQSAERARTLSASKGRRFYLVQEYEMYMTAGPEQRRRMEANFRAGYRMIAISPAVSEMLERCGAPVDAQIPNGIDLDVFRLQKEIGDDSRRAVGFPYRRESFKGTYRALRALESARRRLGGGPDAWSFGADRAERLPSWVRYHRRPSDEDLSRLYNDTAVFVLASDYEGWGLPGCEAMACGAALAATDSGGVRGYAEDAATALLSAPGDVEGLAANVVRLMEDRKLRLDLASRGHEHVQRFTWGRSADALERLLGDG